MNATVDGGAWLRFTQAPLLLRGYLVFALVASLLAIGGIFAPPLSAAIIPYMGWSGLTFYLFTLFFAFAAILTPQRKLIYGVAALLGLAVLFGALDTVRHTWGPEAGTPDYGNPYLIYHPYRPVFTVVVPAVWLLLLVSPVMRKWLSSS